MSDCDPKDVALKSLFLGPQAENSAWLEEQWSKILRHWIGWRRSLFPGDGAAVSPENQRSPLFLRRQAEVAGRLDELLRQLDGESPKFTPRFLGHMTSELALPALLGHLAVVLHNPNQTSREVSVVTSEIEREAIGDLLEMVGMERGEGRGHFTSGGTLANFEAVWRALHRLSSTMALGLFLVERKKMPLAEFLRVRNRGWDWFEANLGEAEAAELAPFDLLQTGPFTFAEVFERITGKRFRAPLIFAPASRHYSWPKAAALLGLGKENLRDILLDEEGRLSLESLREVFAAADGEGRAVLMVISVTGATGTGTVDPVHKVQDFLDERKNSTGEEAWHHVDAAYGGYFCSLLRGKSSGLSSEVAKAFGALSRVSSVTLDPHKLGFVPYSCGAFLARDERHYRSPSFSAPYLLANNEGYWQHTIEGSRAATGAVATWMANRSIGVDSEGYGRILQRGIQAAQAMASELSRHEKEIALLGATDLNILCFFLAREGDSLRECNRRTLECFERFRESPNFSVSKTELQLSAYERQVRLALAKRNISVDDDRIVCLRVVLMNPFFANQESKVSYERAFVEELLAHAVAVRG